MVRIDVRLVMGRGNGDPLAEPPLWRARTTEKSGELASDCVASSVAPERLGRLCEAMERPGEATVAYERFIGRVGGDGRKGLQPCVEKACERLNALSELGGAEQEG